MSGKPAGTREPSGEPWAETVGDAWGVGSNGSSSAMHANHLAAVKRIAVVAWISLGGGGQATHMLRNMQHRVWGSSQAKVGSSLMVVAKSIG